MNISNRALEMNFSPIRKLIPLADEAAKKGIKVYKLNIGQPNIVTPDSFFEGLHSYKEKIVTYSDSRGIPQLIESFVKSYKMSGINLEKEDILITQGGSEAILFTLMCICNEGDEVLVPEPFYSNYSSFSIFSGARVKPIPTCIENNFHLPSKEELESLITPKTKAIMFSNPVNPTGTVYTADEIKMIGELAIKHDLYIIADEVYRQFVYDDIPYTSIMNFEDLKDRVVLVDSISKHYSACGARIGLIASKNHELMNYILKFCQARLCVSTIEQHAAANLINTMENYIEDVKMKYKSRRDLLYGYLKRIPGVVCSKPEGAFYIFAKLPVDNAEKFAKWLLTDYSYEGKTLLIAPGPGFYQTEGKGEQEVRFSFCTNVDDIENAMIVLRRALEEYNK
ncbi:pyridoxal phosphate-dependent aminotransferase [uncultured Fusobacterium sp.]|jgi:aspartate aminotransferase|uniref:pyridoxal phosphate-dependent aminotransferase n=2 Tax=uncultured Fusobacterium sp. TaxID=159267 RepID=UPI0025EC7C64|nr:pyridoxal phosphate-dependent aminotransferase [uncultured Fusobacterium sp.]MCF2639568.1 pyridoxal phosphate-dependent aminotransferase [Fusobacterium varium]